MTDRAVECFQHALEINPANALARLQLGLLQLSMQRPEEALATWRRNLDDKNDFVTRFHSGLALLEMRRRGEARSMFEQAAAHMPKDHTLH